jgi:hypothetical protein
MVITLPATRHVNNNSQALSVKPAKAIADLVLVKQNRFIQFEDTAKSLNIALKAKARDLAGLEGHRTNLGTCPDGTPATADFGRCGTESTARVRGT